MKYNSNRDFSWLLPRAWVWMPRVLEIGSLITTFLINLLIYRSKKDKGDSVKLSQQLFQTLTKLGPCFIKTGQSLSTRPDLVSKEWLSALTKLQDELPAFEHQTALKIIKEDLGKEPSQIFKYFPNEPIASASLGIVYKAQLYDNYWVAVKIQRPDLAFIIRRDLVIIRTLFVIVSPFLPLNLGFGLDEIIDEFGTSLFREIDYNKEADNAERFYSYFSKNKSIKVPRVERLLSSSRVITTSWIDGVKIENRNELLKNNIDPTSIIRSAVISGIQQLLEFGYFHADPHPGNMFAISGEAGGLGEIGYVDFGMMDSISEEDRVTLTRAIVHLVNDDYISLTKDFQNLGFLNKNEDLKKITPVIKCVLGGVLTKEVGAFNLKSVTDSFSELMYNYPFRVPSRFALIIRAVVSQEGLALKLDPSFKIIRFAYPYVAKRLLTDQNDEMVGILTDVLFDTNNTLQVDRLESLVNVIIEESKDKATNLMPVARDSIKLMLGSKGSLIREKLMLSLIKDERINTSEIKTIFRIMKRKVKESSYYREIKSIKDSIF